MSTAFKPANILLPKDKDPHKLEKWAVIACDQYTSQPSYWEEVSRLTEGELSTFHLILPEIYLEEGDVSQRIENIHKTMDSYISNEVFTEYKDAMIYIERVQNDGKIRAGIVGMIDLECYDYNKGSTSAVRATEATVVERIPPRIAVRRGASLELPHIMILIDDPEKTVIEPVSKASHLEKVYDFKFMEQGGSIKGWLLDEAEKERVTKALEALDDLDSFNKRYGLSEENTLVFAMGDGNHSLATAKEFYEELKRNNPEKDMSCHPARYALVEIVNLHSPALEFEAIHRIVTGVDREKLISGLKEALGAAPSDGNCGQEVSIVTDGLFETISITKPTSKLSVGSLQDFLDGYIKENGGKVDYIHGVDVIRELSCASDAVGFVLPDITKDQLFPTVICDGALPRKTFSMGHAEDKRFYVEARKITE